MNVLGKFLGGSLFPLEVLIFGDEYEARFFTHLQCSSNFHLAESLEDKLTCCHKHSQIFEQFDILFACSASGFLH